MNGIKYPVVTKQMLQKNSLEVCEFCEEAFTNRYDSLIHNASHIIIPLLKQNFIACSKCDYQCATHTDLQKHNIVEHPLIIKTEKLNLWEMKSETDIIGGNDLAKDNLKARVGDYASNNNSTELKNEDSEASSDLIITNETDSSPEDDLEIIETIDNSVHLKMTSFRDRLMFESDDVEVLSDSGCIDKFEPPTTAPEHVSLNLNVSTEVTDGADDGNPPLKLLTFQDLGDQPDELHYQSLMRPQTLFCSYCSAMFLSRYSLIMHEQKHIKFKRKIMGMLCLHCDKYIAGDYTNLSNHVNIKHTKDKYKVYCTSVCKKCGLQYRSYKHHIHNYHFTKCCKINKFVTDNHFKNHLDKCLCHTHVLSVCRPCYVVLKEDDNFKCMTLGIKHMKGVLQTCKKCDRKVNEIISVKLSCKIQSKYQCWYVQDKPLSNKDRLKNIRMRLKKLNILSKMYSFVSMFCAS